MKYNELIQLYFERSNALQWYWTIYVLVIGGILGFSLFRRRPDPIKTALVMVLFLCFAYKNLAAIQEVTMQRFATFKLMKETTHTGPDAADVQRVRTELEPTLDPAYYDGLLGTRNFHIMCDLLTMATLWIMERRRRLGT
jgi:hypothetical protein